MHLPLELKLNQVSGLVILKIYLTESFLKLLLNLWKQ